MKPHEFRKRLITTPTLNYRCSVVTAVAIGLSLAATQASALDMSAEGYTLARQWCESCHVIEKGQMSSGRVPSFTEISGDPKTTDEHLQTWLSTPHGEMPDLNLTRNEIAALIDYIDSIKPE
jgi:mono/diheme cytochrome c family protein